MWITVNEVCQFTGLKPKHIKVDTDAELENIVSDWILQCQDLIKQYTNNFNACSEDNIPLAVKNVCLRLCANMVALAIARRDTPVTQVNDWTVQILSSEIFSQDLKDDLDPYVKNRVTGKSDQVMVFTVTGDQEW